MPDILVKTAPGLKCPKEGKHREYITDTPDTGVPVPDSAFYRRLIREGSLILCPTTAEASVAPINAAAPADGNMGNADVVATATPAAKTSKAKEVPVE
jgi:hypothetical protein